MPARSAGATSGCGRPCHNQVCFCVRKQVGVWADQTASGVSMPLCCYFSEARWGFRTPCLTRSDASELDTPRGGPQLVSPTCCKLRSCMPHQSAGATRWCGSLSRFVFLKFVGSWVCWVGATKPLDAHSILLPLLGRNLLVQSTVSDTKWHQRIEYTMRWIVTFIDNTLQVS